MASSTHEVPAAHDELQGLISFVRGARVQSGTLQRVSENVVVLECYGTTRGNASCGLLLTHNGFFLSGAHCMPAREQQCRVRLGNGEFPFERTCIVNPQLDIALGKIALGGAAEAITYELASFQDVTGYPPRPVQYVARNVSMRYEVMVVDGHTSPLQPWMSMQPGVFYTNADMLPGDSGAPVLVDGKFAGVLVKGQNVCGRSEAYNANVHIRVATTMIERYIARKLAK